MQPQNVLFRFGPFLLDPAERVLTRHGEPVRLTPKAFEVLLLLVSRAGHLVTKDELFKAGWPDAIVEEGNLSYTVSLLRKALDEHGTTDSCIATVQKVGYRFTASVQPIERRVAEAAAAVLPDAVTADAVIPGRRPRFARHEWRYTAATAAAVVVAAVASAAYLERRADRRSGVPARVEIVLPPNVEEGKEPSISPDGRLLVMTATINGRTRLAVRPLQSETLEPLPGTEHGWLPVWSPDSRSIAFLQGRRLKRVALTGGSVVDLSELGPIAGGDWNTDGVLLFGDDQTGAIVRVPHEGGPPRAVTSIDAASGETRHQWPRFLSDNRHFLYTADGPQGGLYVGAIDRPMRKRIVGEGRAGHYVEPGHLVFLRDQTLLIQRFKAQTLQTQGEPVSIADNVGLGSIRGTGISVSKDGTIVYRSAQPDTTQLAWYGRNGSRLATAGLRGSYRQLALSRDGRQAAVSARDPKTGNFDIHTMQVEAGVLTPRTTHAAFDGDPVWSPDGRVLLFTSNRTGWMRPFKKDLVTGDEEPLLSHDTAFIHAEEWTADNRILVRSSDAWYTVTEAGPTRLTGRPPGGDQLRVAPDRRLVAFERNEGDQGEVYVATFPEFLQQTKISQKGGAQPIWRNDGRELFYLTLNGVLHSVEIAAGHTSPSAPSRALFTSPLLPTLGLDEYATVDGQRFLFIEKQGQKMTILMNWLDGRP